MVKILWNGRPLNSPWALPYPTDHSDSCNNIFQLIYMQIHADKRAAILKFYTRKTADRKRAIFRRIPARRDIYSNLLSKISWSTVSKDFARSINTVPAVTISPYPYSWESRRRNRLQPSVECILLKPDCDLQSKLYIRKNSLQVPRGLNVLWLGYRVIVCTRFVQRGHLRLFPFRRDHVSFVW